MRRPTRPRPRAHALEDAIRALAQAHGLEVLLVDAVPLADRLLIRGAVKSSRRRADALTHAEAEATR